jgi:hypothetical protein
MPIKGGNGKFSQDFRFAVPLVRLAALIEARRNGYRGWIRWSGRRVAGGVIFRSPLPQ